MGARWLCPGVVLLAAAACELEEVTLVDPEDAVVAEVHVQVFADGGGPGTRATALLHRTLGPAGESVPVPGASVILRRSDGLSLEMAPSTLDECAATTPVAGTGTCMRLAREVAALLAPGDTLSLRIDLPDGGVMESMSVVPGAFELHGIDRFCRMDPDQPVEVAWSRAAGAWAYVNETLLENLVGPFAARGITVDPEDDPLYLLGLSVSAADTTIVFPGEFGVFNRFELDQALAVALQGGLPPEVGGGVTIAAADRNYVNWVRGGNFNPSGQVRVPSIRGDGTGVFGTTVVRRFDFVTASAWPGVPACPGAVPTSTR